MATPKKAAAKAKTPLKVKDLKPKKNPKGGAFDAFMNFQIPKH